MKHLRKFNEASENYNALQKAVAFIEDKMLKYIDSGEIISPNIKGQSDSYVNIVPRFRSDVTGWHKANILNELIESIKVRYKHVCIWDNELDIDINNYLKGIDDVNNFNDITYKKRLMKMLTETFDNLEEEDKNSVKTYCVGNDVIYIDCYNGWYSEPPMWKVSQTVLNKFKFKYMLDGTDAKEIIIEYLDKKHNKNYKKMTTI